MKILHFTGSFFPEYSGGTTRRYNLLSRLPYEIILITSNKTIIGDKIEIKAEYFNNIKVKRIPLHPPYGKIAFLRYFHTVFLKPKLLVKSAKTEKFDIIHAPYSSFAGKAAEQLSKKTKKPYIIEVQAKEEDYLFGFNLYYTQILIKNLLNSCNHITTITQTLRNNISAEYKISEDKITVVPNGADINNFAPKVEYKKKAEELKEKLHLLDDVIMYAGYMDRINGMIDLAKVIPSIITEKPDISFVFIGHGPEEDRIIALSKKYPQVRVLPMVHYDEMPVYYQMCDLFLIPRPSTISAETVTPLKLLELMAMEKPVLGSNVGGIAEVIRHGENGYLFEKGNMESFKKTLLEVLDTDNSQIGKNARKTIVDNYTWDKSAKILQNVYEELV